MCALFAEDAAPPPPLHRPDPGVPLRPALVQIPDGTYTVGSPKQALTWEGPRRANPYELPQRQVSDNDEQCDKTVDELIAQLTSFSGSVVDTGNYDSCPS